MNQKQAERLWPIIKAFGEGETIQCRTRLAEGGWAYASHIRKDGFNPDVFEYRIKREPREFWIHKSIQNMYAHNSEIEARQGAFDGAGIATGSTIIHVREVLDDE